MVALVGLFTFEFETEAELNAVLVTEARLSANILASALLLSALEL